VSIVEIPLPSPPGESYVVYFAKEGGKEKKKGKNGGKREEKKTCP